MKSGTKKGSDRTTKKPAQMDNKTLKKSLIVNVFLKKNIIVYKIRLPNKCSCKRNHETMAHRYHLLEVFRCFKVKFCESRGQIETKKFLIFAVTVISFLREELIEKKYHYNFFLLLFLMFHFD